MILPGWSGVEVLREAFIEKKALELSLKEELVFTMWKRVKEYSKQRSCLSKVM